MNGHRQSGATLIVTLVLLAALSVLTISALQSSMMDELMVAGLHEQASSLAAADAAIREAERWLGGPERTRPPPAEERCLALPAPCRVWPASEATAPRAAPWAAGRMGGERYHDLEARWWARHAVAVDPPEPGAAPSHYLIEDLGAQRIGDSLAMLPGAAGEHRYRITARGVGRSGMGVSIVQVVYARRF